MIVKYAIRQYQCPVCKLVQGVGTNHFGEIYSQCKNTSCKHTGLTCIEPEALEAYKQRPQAKVLFTYYRFNCGNPEEGKQYKELTDRLEAEGYKVFDAISTGNISQLKQYDQTEVTIYDPAQFENQYVSDIGRLFNWYEAIYPNKRIKEGYYIKLLK